MKGYSSLFTVLLMQTLNQAHSAENSYDSTEIFRNAFSIVDNAPIESDIDPHARSFDLNISSDSSTASIKLSQVKSEITAHNGVMRSLTYGISSPIDKKSNESVSTTLDGLNNAARVSLGLTRFVTTALKYPSVQALEICKRLGIKEDQECDTNFIYTKGDKESLREFESQFFEDKSYSYFYGVQSEFGIDDFKFYSEDDLSKNSKSKEVYSLGGNIGLLTGSTSFVGNLLVNLSFKYQETYKAADTKTACPNAIPDDNYQVCLTGAIGEPVFSRKRLYSVELRKQYEFAAVAVKFTFDDVENDKAVDFPIYLLKDKDKLFRGGIKLGWVETDQGSDTVIGLFVRSAFGVL